MKENIEGINGYSLLKDIKNANRRESLLTFLEIILGGTTALSLGEFALSGLIFDNIKNKEYILNVIKNNLQISTLISSLIMLRNKLIKERSKYRLEFIAGCLEENYVYVSVDALIKGTLFQNEKLTTSKTKVTDISLENLRGDEVKLREYTDNTFLGDYSTIYLIDSENRERRVILRQHYK